MDSSELLLSPFMEERKKNIEKYREQVRNKNRIAIYKEE